MNPLMGVLSEAWQMYKTHARHLVTIAFVIYLIAGLLAALFGLAGDIGAVFGLVVPIIAAFLLQAVLTKAVQYETEGRGDLSISDTVAAAMPLFGPVVIVSILAAVGITIGLLLLIVPGLYLLTIWAVIIPVIVIEQSGVMDSFGRSQHLVRGRGWYVFGTLVLLYIIQFAASLVLDVILSTLPGAFRAGLSTVITGMLIAPYAALVVTLIYYRLVGAEAPTKGLTTGRYE